MRIKLTSSLLALGVLAYALPAFAAGGGVTSIGLQDFNHDGKIDRAIVSIANPSNAAWQIRGTNGIGVSYHGQPLTVRSAFMASSGNPAMLEIVLENDAKLPATTAAEGFEVTYAPQGAGSGVSDGTTELSAVAAGDTNASDTELDEAGPVLMSSSPAIGTVDAKRDMDLTLTFSEPVVLDSIIPSSDQHPDPWGFTLNGSVVTASHAPYARGVTETLAVAALDAAGNHVAAGSYPNPFSFRTGTSNDPTPSSDLVFSLSSPVSLQTLLAGSPGVLAWYTNDATIASVRLSYSKDGGVTYLPIATRPVVEGTYVWYPPASSGSIQMKAEALGPSGSVLNAAFATAVNVSGSSTTPRVVAGPDIARITATAAKASVWLDRAASATATCGGAPATVTVSGDRPARLEAIAEGLTSTPITCRFAVAESGSEPLIVVTASITAEGQAPAPPQGEGFITLKEDDLIKAAASSAVYWHKGGKRYVFPNETAYRSWFGTDFSKVVTVPAAQLSALMIGGNVKMKGGVYLIKIQSDPKTYAVEPSGMLRWVQTEAQANELYGAAWNKRIRDVDVSLFVDYTIGAPLHDGERPAGFQD